MTINNKKHPEKHPLEYVHLYRLHSIVGLLTRRYIVRTCIRWWDRTGVLRAGRRCSCCRFRRTTQRRYSCNLRRHQHDEARELSAHDRRYKHARKLIDARTRFSSENLQCTFPTSFAEVMRVRALRTDEMYPWYTSVDSCQTRYTTYGKATDSFHGKMMRLCASKKVLV